MTKPLKEAGVSLVLTAVLLFAMLAMAALAIDGVVLYLARSEAQRAADAAALAGAQSLVDSSYFYGLVNASTAQTIARQRAEAVGGLNKVGGQPASIQDSDVTFDFSRPNDPLVTVVVQRSTARSNAMPTFFARLWGYTSANVKATATAEAFNPSGTGVPATGSCMKPWVLPNCDPYHNSPASSYCSGSGTFINSDGTISNPGKWTGTPNTGGVIGELITLKPGSPSTAPAPSQYYPVQVQLSPNPLCPACATQTGGGGTSGAAVYRENIECCNTNVFTCGQTGNIDVVLLQTGNMQGPTKQGVECLIHENPNGSGQDTLDQNTIPFTAVGGANNPNPAYIGKNFSLSDSNSVVTMPIYDGHNLCPGGSCSSTITIIGFMRVFIQNVTQGGGGGNGAGGNVNAYILDIAGCSGQGAGGGGGGGGGGSNGSPTGAAGSPIPVRLVHP